MRLLRRLHIFRLVWHGSEPLFLTYSPEPWQEMVFTSYEFYRRRSEFWAPLHITFVLFFFFFDCLIAAYLGAAPIIIWLCDGAAHFFSTWYFAFSPDLFPILNFVTFWLMRFFDWLGPALLSLGLYLGHPFIVYRLHPGTFIWLHTLANIVIPLIGLLVYCTGRWLIALALFWRDTNYIARPSCMDPDEIQGATQVPSVVLCGWRMLFLSVFPSFLIWTLQVFARFSASDGAVCPFIVRMDHSAFEAWLWLPPQWVSIVPFRELAWHLYEFAFPFLNLYLHVAWSTAIHFGMDFTNATLWASWFLGTLCYQSMTKCLVPQNEQR